MNHSSDFYDGPTLSVTLSREGNRIHRIIDDTIYPSRASKPAVRRDPMVEALFGSAPASKRQASKVS